MKKISIKRKLWFIRVIKKREKRRRINKQKKIASNRVKSGAPISNGYRLKRYRIVAPETLGFNNISCRNSIISWLKNLRRITIELDQPVVIDFSNSKNAESIGFLLILAEIDTIQDIKGKRYVIGTCPVDNVTAQLFNQVGLSKMLRIRRKPQITHEKVVYWNYINGTRIESDSAGKILVKIASDYGLSDESLENLYNGVTEAMTNTIMHAYPDRRMDNHRYGKNKWWMFAGIKDRNLIVVMCDIGIGIPKSLKKKHPSLYQKVIELLGGSGRDSELIKVAIEEGKTQSEEPHRGLGMAEMKKFITGIGQGKLVIMSSKGAYWYHGKNDRDTSQDFGTSINGTMVAWSIPVDTLETTQ